MNPIPLSWTIGGAVALLAALAGTGWLLWGQIERNGRIAAERDQAKEAVKAAASALEQQKVEMRKQAEVFDAGDRAVLDVGRASDRVRTRVVVYAREIRAAPGAREPACSPLPLGLERLRQLWHDDDIDRGQDRPAAPAGEPDRRSGAAATPAS